MEKVLENVIFRKNRFLRQDDVSKAFRTNLGTILGHLGSQKGAQEESQSGSKTIEREHKNQHEIWKRPGVPRQEVAPVVWVAQAPQEALPGSPGSAPQAPRGLKSQQDY